MGPDEDVTLLKKRRWRTEQPSTATTTAVTTRQLSIFTNARHRSYRCFPSTAETLSSRDAVIGNMPFRLSEAVVLNPNRAYTAWHVQVQLYLVCRTSCLTATVRSMTAPEFAFSIHSLLHGHHPSSQRKTCGMSVSSRLIKSTWPQLCFG